ncbi:uroporphyrinogen-III C-methyltransferase [Sulfuricystis multivorans]|uniref:uroporphyrinogen-III C-methyltransferase n=1 Tax=Sulfuricystis multivorans TaxID=2211108 RepID=UPI000F815F02|nr:uroporphyrinogen-III C-methyltransferase [Sulfuricystis multivorans]
MNDQTETPALTSPPPAERQTERRAQQKVGRPLPWALWMALMALFGLLATAWFAWRVEQRVEATRAELARRLAESDTRLGEVLASARGNRETLDALQAKVGALEAQLAEMQSQQIALAAIYQELSKSREDRLLAEVEQAVSIAQQQLQLAGNVEAALIALSGAEARLAQSAQPQFAPLRKLINRDIERLKALPSADVTGIALKLDGLINAVPSLPLAFERRPAPAAKAGHAAAGSTPALPAAAPGWQGMLSAWLSDVWHELRQLVRIERIDTPDPGLLAPREAFFLRENLRLRLLSARLALLARNAHGFRNDLQQAAAWLDRYFDTRAPAVQEALATLRGLEKLDVMRAPADINETLAALRNFKLGRERGTAK